MNNQNNQQQMMLNNIMQHQFVILDSALYLDTHPNDPTALFYHNTYSIQLKQIKAVYEAMYGPLDNYSSDAANRWRYIDGPWPWEA